jgi:hypothetical protein
MKAISTMVAHPVLTGKALGEMGMGALQVIGRQPIYGPLGKEILPARKPEVGVEKLRPLIDDLKIRYGSVEGFKKALAEHPVEILADISSVLMPAAKVTGSAKAVRAAAATEPISLTLRLASKPFKLLPERIPIDIYQKAVKFGTTLSAKKRKAVTKTALARQIEPTTVGLDKLRGLINDYNSEITRRINVHAKKGTKIPVFEIYKGINKIKNQFKLTSDTPLEWEKAFRRIKGEWKEAIEAKPYRTPMEVQELKKRIYKDLESFYEKNKATPAKTELRLAIAKNARKVIEDLDPELKKLSERTKRKLKMGEKGIKQLNEEEGALIALWNELETKTNRIKNSSLIGFSTYIKTAAVSGIGYSLGGEVGAKLGVAAGLALSIYEEPGVRAKLALVLAKLKDKGIVVKPSASFAMLGFHRAEQVRENKKMMKPAKPRKKRKPIPMGKYETPMSVKMAVRDGTLSQSRAETILKKKFGYE